MKIAVAMHLYYLQMYDEMKRYLHHFGNLPFDLYVTLPRENMAFRNAVSRVSESSLRKISALIFTRFSAFFGRSPWTGTM